MKIPTVLMLLLLSGNAVSATDGKPIPATTASGEKVLLSPNGRWEYVDAARQAEAKKVADLYPENHWVPSGAQGNLFGTGRIILPGDKDYNRGSLNPKMH
jgi:hypothetical protein